MGWRGWCPRPWCAASSSGWRLQLATLALTKYVGADGAAGYALAAAAFVVTVVLFGNRRWPAALLVIALGVAYALVFKLDFATAQKAVGLAPAHLAPAAGGRYALPAPLLLALPQIPLSLGNSILATKQVAHDLFP